MRYLDNLKNTTFTLALLCALHPQGTEAQPTIRVTKSYEDSVRILILYNSTATGWSWCAPGTIPVGPLSKDFIVKSITGIPNVRVLKAEETQWSDVQNAFPGGKLPHVIVHANAGWFTTSGPYIGDVLNRAADQAIGVVSIGDDASQFAEKVFGFTNVDNVPAPMGDATQYRGPNTNLWIDLNGNADTLPAPGVIRNTVNNLNVRRLDFKPFGTDAAGDYRCQEDADKYTIVPSYFDKLNFLGFQRAFDGKDTIAGPAELQTIVAFQDLQRRGVALSFQPQFLKDAKAASQVVYDAILYASYAHFYYSTVSTPVAVPGSTTFLSQLSIQLSTITAGATIYYTLNGKTPDSTGILYNPANPVQIIGNATIKAIAYKPGWLQSGIMTEAYTKAFTPSTLAILDRNGNPLTGGYLTELNSSYTLRLTTTQAGLEHVTTIASTLDAKDAENFVLTDPFGTGSNFIFSGTRNFSIANTGAPGNGKTEAAVYDTLTVSWINPKDVNDAAVAKVPVRPAPKQAFAYFSTKPDGSDTTYQYLGTETKIYLVVVDEVLPPGMIPTVTLETTPKLGSGRNRDTEILILSVNPATPGKYIAAINVDINPSSSPGDKKLQLTVEDLIKATYNDPMDAEPPAVANAGYGVAPEIDPLLQFTDKNGNVLPAGIYYSPAEGALYVDYHDDWFIGVSDTIPVLLTIVNQRNAGPDTETVKLALASHSSNIGEWKGTISLKDGPLVTPGNGISETYILGRVIATVTSHDKAGNPASKATANLLVAYLDQDATLTLEGPGGPSVAISRGDSTLKITLKDQSISSGKDTVFARVSCLGSKDQVSNVMLIETDATSGQYLSGNIKKAEGGKVNDNILQCLSTDEIKVTYTDSVYNETKEVRAPVSNPVTTRVYFTPTASSTIEFSSVSQRDAKNFYIQISAHNRNVAVVDTLHVTVTTANGDVETLVATETGSNTDRFTVAVPFDFVTSAATPQNGTLEGKILPTVANNHVTATATVVVDGTPASASLDLVAAYDPAQKAYIKDSNGDNAADKVYIVFARPLARLPASVDVQWNDGSPGSNKTVAISKLSFLSSDSTVVVADLTSTPFPQGLTSANASNPPHATLPANDALFAGQHPVIEDSIGPVLKSVVKKPANVNALLPNDPNFNLDTLVVTVSEPLKASQDFKDILKFATSCDDYAHAITIVAANNPTHSATDPTVYTVIVDNSTGKSPQTNNCVFLNADPGKFTDIPGNNPPQFGVLLEGSDRTHVIQMLRGFPPVAGLDPNNPDFQVAVQDSRNPDKAGYATPADPVSATWQVLWVPPADYVPGHPYTPYTVANINDLPSGTRETTTPIQLPGNISTIQVVSTAVYIAHVTIFDIYGNFVNASTQVFGGKGELQNLARVVPKGLVSYLYWDMKDRHGQLAGQGVYVWKVRFEFKGGKQEIQYTRTGVIRNR